METEVNGVVLSKSESFWPRFKSRIKPKCKKHSSKPSPSSSYAVEISPATRLLSGKSESSVGIVSISRDGELNRLILSPVGKAISIERQPTKEEKPLGFDAVEIKVKSRDAENSVKSGQSEVSTEELAPKLISEEEVEVALRKSDPRSWVRVAKAFLFPTAPDLHRTSRNGPKLSQDSQRGSHAKDTEMPMIEQPKRQEIRQVNEVADSILRPIDHPCKFSRTSAEVDSKRRKLLKSVDLHRKLSSHAKTPNSSFKGPEIKSLPVSPNSQPKKLNMLAERKGTMTGDATGEDEGYDMAINLSILIIIMGCLAVFSDKLFAVACTSLWWYLLPSLLKRYRVPTASEVNMKRSADSKQWRRRSVSEANAGLHRGEFRKKGLLQINVNKEDG